MSPWPSSRSAPFWSSTMRLSILLATRNAILLGMFDLIRPVTTVACGRCVARIRWMPTARAFCARRTMKLSTSLPLVIIKSASSSMMITMYGSFLGIFASSSGVRGLEPLDQLLLRQLVVVLDVSHAGLGEELVPLVHLLARPFQHAGGAGRCR